MKIALILLAFFLSLVSVRLLANLDRERLLTLFVNPFAKQEIRNPLAHEDPLRKLEELLQERKIDVAQSPIASDSALLVRLASDDTLVTFSETKDLKLQVSSLQIVLNKLTIEGRKAKKIDLQFDNPLVVY